MDEVTKANILKMQGRFSAIEVAIRALIDASSDAPGVMSVIAGNISPTLTILGGTGNPDHLLVADSMRETMEALLSMD